jgi:hypothetical protein
MGLIGTMTMHANDTEQQARDIADVFEGASIVTLRELGYDSVPLWDMNRLATYDRLLLRKLSMIITSTSAYWDDGKTHDAVDAILSQRACGRLLFVLHGMQTHE